MSNLHTQLGISTEVVINDVQKVALETNIAAITAMNLPKGTETKLIFSLGESILGKKAMKGSGDLFELDYFDVPEDAKSNAGKSFPMVKLGKQPKKVSGSQFKYVVENLTSALRFAIDYQSTFGIDFSKVDTDSLVGLLDEVTELQTKVVKQ